MEILFWHSTPAPHNHRLWLVGIKYEASVITPSHKAVHQFIVFSLQSSTQESQPFKSACRLQDSELYSAKAGATIKDVAMAAWQGSCGSRVDLSA